MLTPTPAIRRAKIEEERKGMLEASLLKKEALTADLKALEDAHIKKNRDIQSVPICNTGGTK